VTGENGAEATYRSGAQININAPLASAIEGILTSCQGRLAEIGGFYKLHLGAPDSATFSWTDDDILSSEEQHFTPFFGLADSVNGISAKHPFPADGWVSKVAPPYYRTDLEILDGNRRLLASPSFDFVPYAAQVQRLQKSAIQEAQRARRHALSLPPEFWIVEPGDIGQWSSDRNGYSNKQFRVDGVSDRSNLDVVLNITEVDPSDYSWNHSVEFTPITVSSTAFQRPSAQGILAWSATGEIIKDANGVSRRPAIHLYWDGSLPGISGVQWEVRLKADGTVVTRDRTDQLAIGSAIITQSLLPNTIYQVRGQYIPSSPRDMLWSDWLDVTTPNVLLSIAEFDAAITQQVTTALDGLQDAKNNAEQIIASLGSNDVARNFLDARNVRQELSDQFVITNTAVTQTTNIANTVTQALADYKVTVTAQFGTVTAGILTEQQARTDAVSAVAATVISLTATVGTNTANISSEQTARVNADGALSSRLDTTNANVGGNSAAINQEVLARANGDSALASQITSLTATVNGNSSAITNESVARSNADSAIAANVSTLQTQVGTNTAAISNESVARSNADGSLAAQINSVSSQTGSNTASISTVQSSVNGISVQYGVTGTIDNVIGGFVFSGVRRLDGSVAYGFYIRGDVVIDETLSARKIATGTITSESGVIGALSLKSLSIGDNAVTVPYAQAYSGPGVKGVNGGSYQNVISQTVTVDTTGLSGKTISVLITFTGLQGINGGTPNWNAAINANGSTLVNFGNSTFQSNFALQGIYQFTANGASNQNFNVYAQYAASNNMTFVGGTLSIVVNKR
jgi:limonene-1,2-epoxide hydrolase